ncbi:MAG: 3-hydroxyacyl-CoA dehydrogenase [Rhodospirillales bacterium]|nr:3-hydroxyacyl-CoA dehydrogenase [Rhodospirillales bacterium]
MSKIAIIGSGFIGRAWAISYARAGHDVVIWDIEGDAPVKAVSYIEGVLGDLDSNGLLNGNTPVQVLRRLSTTSDLQAALRDVDYVQENTPENVDIKKKIFAELDVLTPQDAVIASSTSAILPSKFTEELAGRGRCLVVHPINPPYLVPAVEIVPAPWTTPETVAKAKDLLVSAGHKPIVMKRELDGFVMNRLQGALLEEAFRLVEDGYASIEDVDIGIREGLALRWSFMGPFETIDLNAPGGVRDYVERYQSIYQNIFPSMCHRADWGGKVLDQIEADRRQVLAEDKLVDRQIWRDKRLMALAAHKLQAAEDLDTEQGE